MKTYKGMLFCLLLVLWLSGCGKASSAENKVGNSQPDTAPQMTDMEYHIDLSGSFQGIYGCAVLYDPQEQRYDFYREAMGKEEASPYSTFKIVSALSGLKNHVVDNEGSVMHYSGASYPVPAWNGNLTLQEAFQSSCVWYFRQVIDAVGEDEIKKELVSLQYGNGDVSEWEGSGENGMPDLNGFWLDSSLKISPLGQVQVLAQIFEGQSIYKEQDIAVLKNMMLADDSGARKIYGKTGSGPNGEAWFTGFAEENGDRTYFAVYLKDENHKEQVSGEKAREITFDIFDSEKELAGEADDTEKYRTFVKKNHTSGIISTLLADLTGDGRKELIAIDDWNDGEYISMAVYGIRNDGLVVNLYEDEACDTHPGWRWLYLYEKDGKNYLFRYCPVMYQGVGTYSYEIFSLTGEGEEVLLYSGEKACDISREEASEELWNEMGEFLEEVHAYQEASIPLVEIGEDYFDAEYGSFEGRKYHDVTDCDELGIRQEKK